MDRWIDRFHCLYIYIIYFIYYIYTYIHIIYIYILIILYTYLHTTYLKIFEVYRHVRNMTDGCCQGLHPFLKFVYLCVYVHVYACMFIYILHMYTRIALYCTEDLVLIFSTRSKGQSVWLLKVGTTWFSGRWRNLYVPWTKVTTGKKCGFIFESDDFQFRLSSPRSDWTLVIIVVNSDG